MATKPKEVKEEVINVDELSIHKAFRLAQGEFKPIHKINQGAHGYYANLADCWAAIKDALEKYHLSVRHQLIEAEDGAVIAEAIISNDQGIELKSGPARIPYSAKPGQQAHGAGSAETYARRYSLMALCGLCPIDDDGEAASYLPPIDEEALVEAAKAAASQGKKKLAEFKAKIRQLDTQEVADEKFRILRDYNPEFIKLIAAAEGAKKDE